MPSSCGQQDQNIGSLEMDQSFSQGHILLI